MKLLQPFFGLFLIILSSCGKDSDRPPVFHRIQPGCVPSTFIKVEFGSGPSRKFVYNREGQIVYRGIEKLEYKDELLFRIWHRFDNSNYTELYYDDLGQLEETRTYELKNDRVNYDLVRQLKAYYKDGKLVEVENLSTKENYYLTYQENSNNIDSFYVYYKNQFKGIYTYKYDTLNTPYKNIKIPFAGIYTYLSSYASDNNVVESIYYEPGPKPKKYIQQYELKYNKYGYPIKIEETSSGFVSYEEFSYIKCIE